MSCPRELLSLSLSPLYSSTSSLLRSKRQGADWWKKASLNPIPNAQRALKNMNGGGPAAFLSLGIIFSFLQQRQRQRRSAGAREKQKEALSHDCPPALCALRLGEPSHTGNALWLPSLPQLVYSVRRFCVCYDLPDAALLLRSRSFL